MEQFRSLAEEAVKAKRITPAERREISPPTTTDCAVTPTSNSSLEQQAECAKLSALCGG